jgi:hypothetical protein
VSTRRILEIGGLAAGAVLIIFGIVVIVLAINGHSTVSSELKKQQITGTPDMTPEAIKAEGAKAGLKNVDYPTCSVAGKLVDTGSEARCFASYMNRYATPDGKGTNDAAQATKSPNGQPVSNAARDLWVTETALATALNVSYMATQLSLFSLVVGIALLLAGIGFIVLAASGVLRKPEASA